MQFYNLELHRSCWKYFVMAQELEGKRVAFNCVHLHIFYRSYSELCPFPFHFETSEATKWIWTSYIVLFVAWCTKDFIWSLYWLHKQWYFTQSQYYICTQFYIFQETNVCKETSISVNSFNSRFFWAVEYATIVQQWKSERKLWRILCLNLIFSVEWEILVVL